MKKSLMRNGDGNSDDLDESFVDIDDTQLDRECLVQAKRVLRYGRKLAKARERHSEKKAAVDVCAAELSLAIRKDPAGYDLEKVTEPTIEAAVLVTEEHQAAVLAMHRAKYKMDMLEVACTALEHRKRMLEKRIDLLGMEYYAEPRGGTAKAGEEARKKRRKPLR